MLVIGIYLLLRRFRAAGIRGLLMLAGTPLLNGPLIRGLEGQYRLSGKAQ